MLDIATNAPQIEDTSSEIKTALAEQAHLVVDGIRSDEDRARFDRLQFRFNSFHNIRQKYYDADATSRVEIQKVIASVASKAVAVQRDMIAARVRVLALMRAELGFKFDVDAYMKEHIAMAEMASTDLAKTVEEVNQAFQTTETND